MGKGVRSKLEFVSLHYSVTFSAFPDSFIEFMLKHHIANLEKTITEYNQSIENDTLNLENDTLNDTFTSIRKRNSDTESDKG